MEIIVPIIQVPVQEIIALHIEEVPVHQVPDLVIHLLAPMYVVQVLQVQIVG